LIQTFEAICRENRWEPLKIRDFDGLTVISTAPIPDKRWQYLRNTKNQKLLLARKSKRRVLSGVQMIAP
jgi:hypothetical protein